MVNDKYDALKASQTIKESYQRYILSLIRFNDSRLDDAVQKAIKNSKELFRGPYLEATPPYAKGASLQDLIDEGVLSASFSEVLSDSLPGSRLLYIHQEKAIRNILDSNNTIIATGTGSGKTESFMIPLINELIAEKDAGTLTPGVRALLLYPMNALVNDQISRMRGLLANYPDITFGRYTGETKQKKADALSVFKMVNGTEPIKNELISREQMQKAPPHILITNYAMLEYLLLRPRDMELFEGAYRNTWRYIILDEAHVYSGTKGAEIAMLLRRLKDRVGGDDLKFIASSATVGDDMSKVASFASKLFDGDFVYNKSHSDVIEATRIDNLGKADKECSVEEIIEFAANKDYKGVNWQSEKHMSILIESLAAGATDAYQLAKKVFPDIDTEKLLKVFNALIEIGHNARTKDGEPVLSARYHFLISAINGAYACFGVENHISFLPHNKCEICGKAMIEIASCQRCGGLYLVGSLLLEGGYSILQPKSDESKSTTWIHIGTDSSDIDEDDEVIEGAGDDEGLNPCRWCTDCGNLMMGESATVCTKCGSEPLLSGSRQDTLSNILNNCLGCGGRSSGIIRKFQSGSDASTAVITTASYQALPAKESSRYADARNLLMFSDSRQQAAFAAPYLENTYNNLLHRRIVFEAIKKYTGEVLSTSDVLDASRSVAENYGVINPKKTALTKRKEIALWVHAESLQSDSKQSLEGLGLVKTTLISDYELPPFFEKVLGLNLQESKEFIEELVMSVRAQGAIKPLEDIDLRDEALAPRNRPVYIKSSSSDGAKGIISWSPSVAGGRTNKRLEYTKKILLKCDNKYLNNNDDLEADARKCLEKIFEFVNSADFGWFVEERQGNIGTVYRLDSQALRWEFIQNPDELYQCDICKRISSRNAKGVCFTNGCHGELKKYSPSDDDSHYKWLSTELDIVPMTAKEHTAQLDGIMAQEVQKEFIDGKVNILSCSTTFELGVDVGDLQSVFLRDVPPSTANYIQRAGRAGRRADSAALVVTFAQMRSHDQTIFAEPKSLIVGKMKAPIIPINNPRIDERHVFSIVLSAFLKRAYCESGIEYRDASSFFEDQKEIHSNGCADFEDYILNHDKTIKTSIKNVLPPQVFNEIENTWESTLIDRLSIARDEYKSDISVLNSAISDAVENEEYNFASVLKRTIKTISNTDLIGYLSRRNIIPKYGFPVDSVELKITNSELGGVTLSRDLSSAINEYAPGSQVVVAGKIVTSMGLNKVPKKEWIRKYYAVCDKCKNVEISISELPSKCLKCGTARTGSPKRFIEPTFGFIASPDIETVKINRPKSSWTSELYLLNEGTITFNETVETIIGKVKATASVKSEMIALNEGLRNSGYAVCNYCGYAERYVDYNKEKKNSRHLHNNPRTGRSCTNEYLEYSSLGYTYQTDTLMLSIEKVTDEATTRSLLYAVLNAAATKLEISRDDINGTIVIRTGIPCLVIFDTVPAGAGLSSEIATNLKEVIHEAIEHTRNCECGIDSSCYRCLRVYNNQNYHDELKREHVINLLE